MDTELFSTQPSGGGLLGRAHGFTVAKDAPIDDHVKYAKYNLYHVSKHAIKIVVILLVMYMIVYVFTIMIPLGRDLWAGKLFKGAFTNKEGLQWLGASTDVVRGDYENNQDSLAERALKRDTSVTDMAAPAPVKLSFTTRERMTPEEELMKKQEGAQ